MIIFLSICFNPSSDLKKTLPEDRESLGPLMTVDPVLNGHPSPLVVIPLPHQGGVAGATGVGCTRLVRGSTAKGGSQLQQKWEVGQGP